MITLKEHLIRQKVQKKNPYDAIDLRLPSGTLWCSHNVGTQKPEEYGDYFAWGETEPKKEYTWDTYRFINKNNFTKYNDKDNKTQLDLEDDVAHVILGGDWHMPTKEQMQELIDETTSKWITQNGVKGRLFTGSNGNSIFIPAAGYHYGFYYEYVRMNCILWSSTLSKHPLNSYYLFFASEGINIYCIDRFYGYPVRGVIS